MTEREKLVAEIAEKEVALQALKLKLYELGNAELARAVESAGKAAAKKAK